MVDLEDLNTCSIFILVPVFITLHFLAYIIRLYFIINHKMYLSSFVSISDGDCFIVLIVTYFHVNCSFNVKLLNINILILCRSTL